MKVVVFAMVSDSCSVAKVQQAVDSIEVPGCPTGWCKVDVLLVGVNGIQIRVEVELYVFNRRKRKEKEKFLRDEIRSICSKYFY